MSRPHLLLLHGALGAKDQFDRFAPYLEAHFQLHLLDFEGHGACSLEHDTFHSDHLMAQVRGFIEQQGIVGTHVLGYSLGGYVACALARTAPELAGQIMTVGTRYPWDDATFKREARFLDPKVMQAKVPHFADMLAKRHTAEGWKRVVTCTQDLLRSNAEVGGLSPEQMSELPHRIRVVVGDRDRTAGVTESVAVYRALQNGELEVWPATPHPLEKVPAERLVHSVKAFFDGA